MFAASAGPACDEVIEKSRSMDKGTQASIRLETKGRIVYLEETRNYSSVQPTPFSDFSTRQHGKSSSRNWNFE